MTAPVRPDEPLRILGPVGAIAIIVGIVIGAGIFKTPSMVAGITGDSGWIILVWVLGGMISLAGALCYAELCTTYPHAGGDYHFLSQALGKNVSFLYAWAKATVINTGSIALLAFVFGDYMTQVVALGEYSTAIWAVGIVLALTAVNILGIHTSSRMQTLLTLLVIAGLAGIVVAGFSVAGPSTPNPAWFSSNPPIGMLGLAMVFVLLTYGGWNEAAYISAEVKGGVRAIVPVIVISILLIAAIYLLVNIALIHGLGVAGLANSKAAGADLLGMAFGPWGQKTLGLFVALAALTSINATMIVGARTNFALGRDWARLRLMGQWRADRGTPTLAYLIQAGLSLALVGFGILQTDGFETMVEFTAPVFWAFLFLVGISLLLLRAKHAGRERPFRVPLYPITPIIFCAACGYLTYSSITYAASKNAVHVSLMVMAVGVVAMLLLRGRRSAKPA
jgi:basic amino acid/polyamine antiporter, APA family